MRVAVPAQRGAHGPGWRRLGTPEQLGQIIGLLTGRLLSNDFGGRWANSSQGLQRALPHQAVKLTSGQSANNLGSAPEGADPVGRSPSTLQLEGDLPQCPSRFHNDRYTAEPGPSPSASRSDR